MTDLSPDEHLIVAVLATTDFVAKYGDSLHRSALERMREFVLATPTMLFEHDPGRPMRARVTDAEVRERADGVHELTVTLAAPESTTRQLLEMKAANDGKLGWSFGAVVPDGVVGRANDPNPAKVTLAVDPLVWDLEARQEAGVLVSATMGEPVAIGQYRRYGLSDEIAQIVLQVGPDVLVETIKVALQGAFDYLCGRRRSRDDKSATAPIRVELAVEGERTTFSADCSTADDLAAVMEHLPGLVVADWEGRRQFDFSRSEWLARDDEKAPDHPEAG